jgi:hypothetical protein
MQLHLLRVEGLLQNSPRVLERDEFYCLESNAVRSELIDESLIMWECIMRCAGFHAAKSSCEHLDKRGTADAITRPAARGECNDHGGSIGIFFAQALAFERRRRRPTAQAEKSVGGLLCQQRQHRLRS